MPSSRYFDFAHFRYFFLAIDYASLSPATDAAPAAEAARARREGR